MRYAILLAALMTFAVIMQGCATGDIRRNYTHRVGSVYRIDIYKNSRVVATGSGGLVSSQGQVLTAAHVVRGTASTDTIKAVDIYGKEAVCSVQRRDGGRDLALLGCPSLVGRPFLRRSPFIELAVGDDIFVISAPRGITLTLTKGIVSQLRGSKGDVMCDILIAPGSSGAPVFDKWGRLIGVVQRAYMGIEWGTNAAVIASPLKLRRFMEGWPNEPE